MNNGYGVTLSPLAIICQEREAWKAVGLLSRTFKDRKVHAFSKKQVKELGSLMMSIANDEMTSEDESDRTDEEEFGGDYGSSPV